MLLFQKRIPDSSGRRRLRTARIHHVDFRHGNNRAEELIFNLPVSLALDKKEYRESREKMRKLDNKAMTREAAIRAICHEEEAKLSSAVRSMAWAAELDPEIHEYHYDLARIHLEQDSDLSAARTHVCWPSTATPASSITSFSWPESRACWARGPTRGGPEKRS